jgi:hypothetical protein
MVKSHIFMRKFFVEEWYMHYIPDDAAHNMWTYGFALSKNTKEPHKNEWRLRMTQKRIYYLYRRFCREFYSQSKVRDFETFWEELGEVGIYKHNKLRRIHEKQRNVCDIYYSKFHSKMCRLYNGIEIEMWSHEKHPEEFIKNVSKWENY